MAVHYFAYGSCMDENDFKRTVGGFTTLGPATLKNYRLGFTLYGQSRAGGVADVLPSTGNEVQGVLFSFPDQWLKELDLREGVPERMYERIKVVVQHKGAIVPVYTYQVVNKAKNEIAPSEAYLELMLNGMNKYATQAYVKQFKENTKRQFGLEI